MGIFSHKSKDVALPFPRDWTMGDPVEPFSSRWGKDAHNDALIDESALWSRFADSMPSDEIRWMVGPITVVFPEITDIRAPGHLFCTDKRFIAEVTPEGHPWHDYRTMEIALPQVNTLGPSRFGKHIVAIGYGDPGHAPEGLFFILHMPIAPYLHAVMMRLVQEKSGLKRLGSVGE